MSLDKRPNILLAIADDQSWPYASVYGSQVVNTPTFDRIAREGVLFRYGYCPAPQCSPSRAALLTGRNIWQLEEAGTHASIFPAKFQVYPDLLQTEGYHVGYTGKPWAPGDWEAGGRTSNPAGQEYNRRRITPPTKGISNCDYAGNFDDFLQARPEGQPFCFWFGCREPHRTYEEGSGARAGKRLEDVDVPPFLPDVEVVRSDILDYALEIDWFDAQLAKMIARLEEMGELDNTLVVVTSDNGMPFPRAKASNYEHGTHVPLAIRWSEVVPAGRVVDDLVSFIDLAPTFLEAAGVTPPSEMTGRSILPILRSPQSGRVDPNRDFVVTGRERHTHARPDNVGYPVRAIRVHDYLYIRNFKPELWPAGNPEYDCMDIDNSPSKRFLVDNKEREGVGTLYELACGRRPAEELYDMKADPACLDNVAEDPAFAEIREALGARLERILRDQKDPRILGYGDIFDSYPRVSPMREWIPGFSEQGKYNASFQKLTQEAKGAQ